MSIMKTKSFYMVKGELWDTQYPGRIQNRVQVKSRAFLISVMKFVSIKKGVSLTI
jgi:hypothetical protein